MAATTSTPAVIDVLRGADKRWATRQNDDPASDEYLQHLAAAMAPHVGTPTTSAAEIRRLKEQAHHAETNATKRQGELEQARAKIDELTEQLATAQKPEQADNTKVREQEKLIKKLREDYDALAAEHKSVADQLAATQTQRNNAVDHRCVWKWHGPDQPMNPCECGRPVPRYELREVS